ncbi:macrolide ABC transporter ATP-binding protein/permease MacB [Iodobacter fluviatilis]|uniref:Macrolide export ATP-binding/permease protein MacB n=1 Tax=Iodobacter fluviatilis TaxID=537 RepID=A0A377SUT0_9NEIS|nr:macrolide ABC transporter ATP-binding protein/permease MacB [Iodobacter fluviatilis]TCU82240.1 macrolide transport system ATP-binding/permease protein [Iodobacter fluviatilis]STR45135.1 Macrolide export ATP-binding/permease protein MacB [Iodobacter fluviatilis]
MRKPLLELSQIVRSFPAGDGEAVVLDQVNLCIHAGEMVAIVGASGSGKSTLMNILGCLDKPTSGTYLVNGRDVSDLDSDELAGLRRDRFGFIFQRYHLLPHLSAQGNVEMPAVYSGLAKDARQDRAKALLRRLGLSDKLEHRPSQLSGGQQQRVSIARALMNGGEVILADEPTGALDSHSGEEVMNILRELHAQGHTVIIVTHDHKVADCAERIVEISDGRIISDRSKPVDVVVEGKIAPHGQEVKSLRVVLDRFAAALNMAWRAMSANRMRTLLTMLGVVIGITSVVSIVAIGEGAKRKILQNIGEIGSNTMNIFPGKDWGDDRAGSLRSLLPGDITALQAMPFIDSVTPSTSTNLRLRHRALDVSSNVSGVGEYYFRVSGLKPALGRFFNSEDVATQSQLVVIDHNTLRKLFPKGADPLGKVILVGNLPATVIGVAAENKSGFGGGGQSLQVWLPFTTTANRLFGQQYFNNITVRVKDGQSSAAAEQSIEKLLTLRHGSKDFFIYNMDSIVKKIEQTSQMLALLLSMIALISLVVGGIGVMNIMLVSVTERTREIGIRMAVGARQSDVMQQFLTESVLVCLIGGVIGVLLSLGIGALVQFFVPDWKMIFSLGSFIAAFICSTLIGVFFGFLPARNAARLDPIEALARE